MYLPTNNQFGVQMNFLQIFNYGNLRENTLILN